MTHLLDHYFISPGGQIEPAKPVVGRCQPEPCDSLVGVSLDSLTEIFFRQTVIFILEMQFCLGQGFFRFGNQREKPFAVIPGNQRSVTAAAPIS